MDMSGLFAVSAAKVRARLPLPQKTTFVMVAILLTIGLYLLYPVALIFGLSFNTATEFFVGTRTWGLANWEAAFSEPKVPTALFNTVWLWVATHAISFPFGVVVAWLLARSRLPGSHALEFMYWISYVTPGGLVAWIMMFDPNIGIANKAVELLPFVDDGPFNIFSVPGIVFTNVVSGAVATSVIILTPVFRNMDAALEEAARVSGASNVRTMIRVTIPVMVSPIVLLLALQLVRMFQSFERELILGAPIGFYVYSTLIYDLVRLQFILQYGQAAAMASVTLAVIALIVPLQRWILQRRQYTTITGSFKPGLIDLGPWKWVGLSLIVGYLLLDVASLVTLVLGSFMSRVGYFSLDPLFTPLHWSWVLHQPAFYTGLRTTLILATASGIFSPLLFALLAYVLVRTRWRLRFALDTLIWLSAAIPGILSGLGLMLMFLWTPGLSFLFGTLWVLIIVVIMQGGALGVNLMKGNIVQVGSDMEDAARIAGAGWLSMFVRVWLRIMAPYLVLIGLFNFNIAANTTASIILLADYQTQTLSLLILEYLMPGTNLREPAAVIQIIVGTITLSSALIARRYGLRLSLQHH